jgi:hypothetical protein
MKFICNICRKQFTTLADRDKHDLSALKHISLDQMKCPYCGANNKAIRFRNHGRGWGSNAGEEDVVKPSIELHPDCKRRTIYNADGFGVVCDGCKSMFNCYTGNIDDGTIIQENEFIAPPPIKIRTVETNYPILTKLRERLASKQFSFKFQKETWYAQFVGTIWKLSNDDVVALTNGEWGKTIKTQAIQHTLQKYDISVGDVRQLFEYEKERVVKK